MSIEQHLRRPATPTFLVAACVTLLGKFSGRQNIVVLPVEKYINVPASAQFCMAF